MDNNDLNHTPIICLVAAVINYLSFLRFGAEIRALDSVCSHQCTVLKRLYFCQALPPNSGMNCLTEKKTAFSPTTQIGSISIVTDQCLSAVACFADCCLMKKQVRLIYGALMTLQSHILIIRMMTFHPRKHLPASAVTHLNNVCSLYCSCSLREE